MSKRLLLAVLGLSLAACQRADEENDIVPAAVATTFDQDFSLNYRQQATVSSASSQPELTVAVADLNYKFCPKNAYCFTADFVNPTLSVTDEQGQTQEVKLSMRRMTGNYPAWSDTASVRANGRRYMFYYIIYDVKAGCDNPEKKDISIALRVSRPNNK